MSAITHIEKKLLQAQRNVIAAEKRLAKAKIERDTYEQTLAELLALEGQEAVPLNHLTEQSKQVELPLDEQIAMGVSNES